MASAAAGVFHGLFFLAVIFFLQPKEIWALFFIGSTGKAFWVLKQFVYINMSICDYVFKEQWSLLCEDLMSAGPGVWKLFSVNGLIKDGTSLCVLCLAYILIYSGKKNATFIFKTGTKLQSNMQFKTIKMQLCHYPFHLIKCIVT